MVGEEIIWYPISEAAAALSVSSVEIRRMIDVGELQAALYLARQRFLVFSRLSGGKIVGHATFSYAGALQAQEPVIRRLLSGDSFKLLGSPLFLLDPNAVRDWDANCAYRHLGKSELSEWRAIESFAAMSTGMAITPMPSEVASRTALSAVLDQPGQTPEGEQLRQAVLPLINKIAPNDYKLDYSHHSKLEASALVVGIDRNVAGAKLKPAVAANQLPEDPPLEKTDRLTHIIWAILRDDLHTPTKSIWSTLKRELESADPKYDPECDIVRFGQDELVFSSGAGGEKTVRWSAFQSRVDRLKAAARTRLKEQSIAR